MQEFIDSFLLFWQELPQNIGPYRDTVVNIVVDFSGLSYEYSQLALFAVIALMIVIVVLSKIHSGLIGLQRKRVQACIYEYDRVWYFVAKAMYSFNKKMKEQ